MKLQLFLITLLILGAGCAKDEMVNPENPTTTPISKGYNVTLDYQILQQGENQGTLLRYDAVKINNNNTYESLLTPGTSYSGVLEDIQSNQKWSKDISIPLNSDKITFTVAPYQDFDCVNEALSKNTVSPCIQQNNGDLSIVTISFTYSENGILKMLQRTMELKSELQGDHQKITTCSYYYENGLVIDSECENAWTPIGYGPGIDLSINDFMN